MKEETQKQAERRQVMKEKGPQDVGYVIRDLEKDTTGAKYLRLGNSASFAELCSYVVELPILEQWHQEVKIAKHRM